MMRLAVPFVLLIVAAAATGYCIGRGPKPGLESSAITAPAALWAGGPTNGEPAAASRQNREPSTSETRKRSSAADDKLTPSRHRRDGERRAPEEQSRAVRPEDPRLEVDRAVPPRFMLPLAFLPEGADAGPVALGRARELVPGAFGMALSEGIAGEKHGRGASNASAAPVMESASETLREQSLARLRGQFEETMRQSGLDPETAAYLNLWNWAQGISDRQFAIWYGGDAAMRRQAAAYKLTAGQMRSGTNP